MHRHSNQETVEAQRILMLQQTPPTCHLQQDWKIKVNIILNTALVVYIFLFVEITFNLCHKLWNDVTDYGESTKVKFNANLRLTNGDETSNSYSTSDSLLPNKSKSTKKIAFEIDVSHKKNGSLDRYKYIILYGVKLDIT